MDNLEEMDKFLENYNFPKLNQEEIENLNRLITSTEIETVIKNLPDPGIESGSPTLQVDALPSQQPGRRNQRPTLGEGKTS